MSKKIFVLDTNVLLHDPQALLKFEDNDVYVPIVVIEEIDNFKKDMNEIGRNARYVSRFLDGLREKGKLCDGVPLGEGLGNVYIPLTRKAVDLGVTVGNRADNEILKIAVDLTKEMGDKVVVFITKDTNLRIKADALGVPSEDYENDKIQLEDLYSGSADYYTTSDIIAQIYDKGEVPLPEDLVSIFPNEFVTLINSENPKQTALARYNSVMKSLDRLGDMEPIWGITPRNKEQTFALNILLDPEISLVTLVGKAGTGKTLLAIAAGLLQVADSRIYDRMLIARPIIPMGKDLGYLPGDVGEKMRPWMQPIFDNLDFLISGSEMAGVPGYQELITQKILHVEPLTYIRGRSIPRQYMIIDEAQNLTPHEVKTIITRAGEGTKVVLTGDPYQIDNPYVDSNSNGLSYLVEHFKEQGVSGHVTLEKGERSALAELAAKLL
ncbi:MAG: PhoH family protein [Acidobacteria bacterium]|nr:MAG: PhoH family protein [Acidobacteriota bacterium]